MQSNIQPYLKSLTTCLNRAIQEEFTETFEVQDHGVQALRSRKFYTHDAVAIVNSFSFQGESDPSGVTLLILQTDDGLKGTLVDNTPQHQLTGFLQKAGKPPGAQQL